ncbi:hypothetical protein [Emticicia sp. SJ17W-69]|uniref:hypothetical protein n=1 Tax=Emticicia sp. SJ17W-69 TaxID=3421657 RepID=UPI003EBF6355
MKKKLLISVFTLIAFSSKAQSITLSPNNLQIPSVSVLPACAAADYGKIVFLTTTNRANVCSGSGWMEVATGGGGGSSLTLPYSGSGTFSTQGFQVINTGGGVGSSAIQGNITSSLTNTSGILGSADATNPSGETIGVKGINSSTNNNGIGVKGTHAGSGYGVYGYSLTGTGVYGFTQGSSSSGYGVFGQSGQVSGVGVHGNVFGTNGTAVWGKADHLTAAGGYFQNTAGGYGLVIAGKMRYQGNSAGVDKVLVSTDISGTAEWQTLTRNEILKLGPGTFVSHVSSNESTQGSRGVSMTSATGSFHANISLPDAASINELTIYYIDNDGVSPSTGLGLTSYGLQKMSHSGSGAYTNITGANGTFTNISASTNVLSVTSPPLTEVVNNSVNFYRLVVTMPASTNLILVGAAIKYSYTLNN